MFRRRQGPVFRVILWGVSFATPLHLAAAQMPGRSIPEKVFTQQIASFDLPCQDASRSCERAVATAASRVSTLELDQKNRRELPTIISESLQTAFQGASALPPEIMQFYLHKSPKNEQLLTKIGWATRSRDQLTHDTAENYGELLTDQLIHTTFQLSWSFLLDLTQVPAVRTTPTWSEKLLGTPVRTKIPLLAIFETPAPDLVWRTIQEQMPFQALFAIEESLAQQQSATRLLIFAHETQHALDFLQVMKKDPSQWSQFTTPILHWTISELDQEWSALKIQSENCPAFRKNQETLYKKYLRAAQIIPRVYFTRTEIRARRAEAVFARQFLGMDENTYLKQVYLNPLVDLGELGVLTTGGSKCPLTDAQAQELTPAPRSLRLNLLQYYRETLWPDARLPQSRL